MSFENIANLGQALLLEQENNRRLKIQIEELKSFISTRPDADEDLRERNDELQKLVVKLKSEIVEEKIKLIKDLRYWLDGLAFDSFKSTFSNHKEVRLSDIDNKLAMLELELILSKKPPEENNDA